GDQARFIEGKIGRPPLRSVVIPALRAGAASSNSRLNEEVAARQRFPGGLRAPFPVACARQLLDCDKSLVAADRVEYLLVAETLARAAIAVRLERAIAAALELKTVKIV